MLRMPSHRLRRTTPNLPTNRRKLYPASPALAATIGGEVFLGQTRQTPTDPRNLLMLARASCTRCRDCGREDSATSLDADALHRWQAKSMPGHVIAHALWLPPWIPGRLAARSRELYQKIRSHISHSLPIQLFLPIATTPNQLTPPKPNEACTIITTYYLVNACCYRCACPPPATLVNTPTTPFLPPQTGKHPR